MLTQQQLPRKFFKLSNRFGARSALIKTGTYARLIWEKNVVKSFTLIITILLLCLKLKSSSQTFYQTTLTGIVINSELTILPEKLCLIWTATRDLKQRKFNLPSIYRYGLDLRINWKLVHVFCPFSWLVM
jgi:hypothetical protein